MGDLRSQAKKNNPHDLLGCEGYQAFETGLIHITFELHALGLGNL